MSGPQNSIAISALRELISSKAISGGFALTQAELATTLGMSRNPVRLALAQLEHDGLLRAKAGGGFVLRSFTKAEIVDAIDLRAALEGEAARLAATHNDEPDAVKWLEKCCGDMEKLGRRLAASSDDALEEYLQLNERFHEALFHAAGSEALSNAYRHLLHLPFASPSAVLRASRNDKWLAHRLECGRQQHRAILNAVRSWDEARAERLARKHALLTKQRLEWELTTNPTMLDRLPGGNLARADALDMEVAGL